jgi:uncharacterized protein (TIGR02588 family)
MARKQDKAPREPLLEWIAAGLGLVLTLGVIGVIGREAIAGETQQPPAIDVRAVSLRSMPSGFLVEVVAANRSGGTGAAVTIEGELKSGETSVETSDFTFDYVPGHAERRGGLFFKEDPRKHQLELRALGYQQP